MINVDAYVEVNLGMCYVACTTRNQTGKVLLAQSTARIKCQDMPEDEARVCLLGLQSIHDVETASIILESNNSCIVEAIKHKK
jgi:hypothetical protein